MLGEIMKETAMRIASAALVTLALATPAFAIEPSMQLVLPLSGNAQRDVRTYHCEGTEAPMVVEYVNSDPTFIAFVPVGDQKLLFVNVIAASGAKYASGQYVWWTKGTTADLYDETKGEDAKPVSCEEINETP